jgi:hypothetical protein
VSNTSLTFLAEIDASMAHEDHWFRLTREGLFDRESFTFDMEERLIAALGLQPELYMTLPPDEEIVVTFTRRKKCP